MAALGLRRICYAGSCKYVKSVQTCKVTFASQFENHLVLLVTELTSCYGCKVTKNGYQLLYYSLHAEQLT